MQYQPPSSYPVPPPQKSSWRQRFQRLPKLTKAGLGCASVLFVLSLCICSVSLANTDSAPSTASQNSVTSVPTDQPTAPPSRKPTPPHHAATMKHVATPRPTARVQQSVPTPIPPTQAPATGVNGNPWNYDFTPGNLIYTPNTGFCNYFSCVTTFWTKTSGYVVECANQEYSHSGGVSGACSRDGGIEQPLYSH